MPDKSGFFPLEFHDHHVVAAPGDDVLHRLQVSNLHG